MSNQTMISWLKMNKLPETIECELKKFNIEKINQFKAKSFIEFMFILKFVVQSKPFKNSKNLTIPFISAVTNLYISKESKQDIATHQKKKAKGLKNDENKYKMCKKGIFYADNNNIKQFTCGPYSKPSNQKYKQMKKMSDLKKSTPCIFYQNGACNKGKSCPFQHCGLDDANDAALLYDVCWDFASGNCPRGKKCQWLHFVPQTNKCYELNQNCKQKENKNKKDTNIDINIEKCISLLVDCGNKSEFEKEEYLLCFEKLKNNKNIFDGLFFRNGNELNEEMINNFVENHQLRTKFFELLNKKTFESCKEEKNENGNELNILKEVGNNDENRDNELFESKDTKSISDLSNTNESGNYADNDAKQPKIAIFIFLVFIFSVFGITFAIPSFY